MQGATMVIIAASLSEAHQMRSTVKFVFLLACLIACLFSAMHTVIYIDLFIIRSVHCLLFFMLVFVIIASYVIYSVGYCSKRASVIS